MLNDFWSRIRSKYKQISWTKMPQYTQLTSTHVIRQQPVVILTTAQLSFSHSAVTVLDSLIICHYLCYTITLSSQCLLFITNRCYHRWHFGLWTCLTLSEMQAACPAGQWLKVRNDTQYDITWWKLPLSCFYFCKHRHRLKGELSSGAVTTAFKRSRHKVDPCGHSRALW